MSISWYKREIGKKSTDAIILGKLEVLKQYIKSDMTDLALSELVKDIYSECYMLTPVELSCMFYHLKTAKYITRSASEILCRIKDYVSMRFDVAETLSIQKHNEVKSNSEVMEDELLKKWYKHKKINPIEEDQKDKKIKDDQEFKKFKAEYERKKINNNF